MDLGLSGKAVIVTGGGSNIGKGISIAFGEEGAHVIIAEIDEVQGQKVANLITAKGGKATVIKTDVTDTQSVNDLVKTSIDKFGKVDILVNNVGWTMYRLFAEKPVEEWEKEIKLNYWSVLNCSKAVTSHMIERKYGKIISIASDAGRVGEVRGSVYGGCKGAIIAFSKSLALELGRFGINVNVVCPAIVPPANLAEDIGKHSMSNDPGAEQFLKPEVQAKMAQGYPLRRLGKAQDIGNMVVFLASDRSNFVTGQTISVNGGYSMV